VPVPSSMLALLVLPAPVEKAWLEVTCCEEGLSTRGWGPW
jgi:hypothetical protein